MTRLALPEVELPAHVADAFASSSIAPLRIQVGLRWDRPHYLNRRQAAALQAELRRIDGDAWPLTVFRDGLCCLDGTEPAYWRKPLIELSPFVHQVFEAVRGPIRGFWVPTGWREVGLMHEDDDPAPSPLGYPDEWGLPWSVLEHDPPAEDWFTWSPA